MTYEEIKEIRANKPFISKEGAEYSQMIDAAIEKQIPKKPRFVDYKFYKSTFAHCPNCNYCFGETKPKMCVNVSSMKMLMRSEKMCSCEKCGQRIDFTEEGAEE